MSKRQNSSTRRIFDGVASRRKDASRRTVAEPSYSPLLIIQSSTSRRNELATRSSSSFEDDVLEIKNLCQSPRSNRVSMFRFSPTSTPSAGNSPTLSHKELSHNSSLSQESLPASTLPALLPTLSERKRHMVINEIASTEAKYVENLNVILSTFLSSLETVVSPRSLRQLIPAQLDQLLESHEELLGKLQDRLRVGSEDYDLVGDIFLKLCSHSNVEFFNMYRVYMGEFKIAMKTLSTYEKESNEFKEVLEVLQQGPLCEHLSLASYLLTPVQRLPRYELLLKELLKHTPASHPDNVFVEEALGSLHGELVKLNQSIKSCQLVCSANGRSARVKFNQSTNNLTRKVKRKSSRKAKRTLTMLKRFVSTPNIDDYSSEDSSMAEDMLTLPHLHRRRNAIVSSVSICDSEVSLSESIQQSSGMAGSTALSVLSDENRAVSCSDLWLEFGDKTKQRNFKALTPLVSEACTPASIASHRCTPQGTLPVARGFSLDARTSLVYSSSSSISSGDQASPNCSSVTPTEDSFRELRGAVDSTPVLRVRRSLDENATRKLREVPESDALICDRFSACLSMMEESAVDSNTSLEEGEFDEGNCPPRGIHFIDSEAADSSGKKGNWRSMVGRKFGLTKKSKNEMKYLKTISTD